MTSLGTSAHLVECSFLWLKHFLDPVMGSSTGDKDGLSSVFPSFYTEADNTSEGTTRPPLGFLAFGGIMFGDTQKRFGMYVDSVYTHIHGCMCRCVM